MSAKRALGIAQRQIPSRIAGEGDSDGVFHPSCEWGRASLQSARRHPSATRTWSSDVNSVSFNSSSRTPPLMGEDGPALSAPAICWRSPYR